MTTIAIEFNDAALVAVGPDGVLGPGSCAEPGYAIVAGGAPLFGKVAWGQARLRPRDVRNRFWRELSAESMSEVAGPYATSADLVHAHLQSLWQGWSAGVTAAIFVVPDYWSREQLGFLLGIAEELAIPVVGLVDSAVASTRCPYEVDDLLHVDISLHATAVTRMKQDGGAAIDSRQSIDGIGTERLERICVEHIAARFLEDTRFDPLHDATSEQVLYDSLGELLRSLQRSDSVTAAVERGGDEYTVLIERSGLVAVLALCCEPIMQHIRSRLTAGQNAAFQLTERLAVFPGIVDAIDRLPQVATFVLESGAAARGALGRAGQFVKTNGSVSLKTLLRWDRRITQVAVNDNVELSTMSTGLPTHVLYAQRAYRIERQPLHVGSELAAGEYGINLSSGNRGVSRRHCSIQAGANGTELIDHSRFGTRLNGHAIDQAAVLQVGDIISVGEPPVEMRVIAEFTSQGSGDGA